MMIIILLILILITVYLYLIYPGRSRREKMLPYEKRYIAHRGLFNNFDVPENSISAFSKAVANDYGIELDLQLTSDKKLVVFHDDDLYRMTGINKKVYDCSYDELSQYRLLQTEERIPLFEEVLNLLNPDTPLIIEIKPEGDSIATTKAAVEMLRNYEGLYNIESFDPAVGHYLKENEPDIIRGQLAFNSLNDPNISYPYRLRVINTFLLTNYYSRPDYIAYDCNTYKNLSFWIVSRVFKTECVAWTVKSDQQFEQIRNDYNCFIFDSYIPKAKL